MKAHAALLVWARAGAGVSTIKGKNGTSDTARSFASAVVTTSIASGPFLWDGVDICRQIIFAPDRPLPQQRHSRWPALASPARVVEEATVLERRIMPTHGYDSSRHGAVSRRNNEVTRFESCSYPPPPPHLISPRALKRARVIRWTLLTAKRTLAQKHNFLYAALPERGNTVPHASFLRSFVPSLSPHHTNKQKRI